MLFKLAGFHSTGSLLAAGARLLGRIRHPESRTLVAATSTRINPQTPLPSRWIFQHDLGGRFAVFAEKLLQNHDDELHGGVVVVGASPPGTSAGLVFGYVVPARPNRRHPAQAGRRAAQGVLRGFVAMKFILYRAPQMAAVRNQGDWVIFGSGAALRTNDVISGCPASEPLTQTRVAEPLPACGLRPPARRPSGKTGSLHPAATPPPLHRPGRMWCIYKPAGPQASRVSPPVSPRGGNLTTPGRFTSPACPHGNSADICRSGNAHRRGQIPHLLHLQDPQATAEMTICRRPATTTNSSSLS